MRFDARQKVKIAGFVISFGEAREDAENFRIPLCGENGVVAEESRAIKIACRPLDDGRRDTTRRQDAIMS